MQVSERKLAANRANAAKTRPYARRKAFLIGTVLLPHESSGRFGGLFDSLCAEYNPQDHTERILVEKMAVAHWCLLRIWSLETAGLALEARRQAAANPSENPPDHTLRAMTDAQRHSDLLGRQARRYDREFYNALRALKGHRQEKNEKKSPAATELVEYKKSVPNEQPPLATDSQHAATPEPSLAEQRRCNLADVRT